MAEEITSLLVQWSAGDESALSRLMPLVYDELRRLARGYLRRQADVSTLQPTVLVHEAYLRLVDQRRVNWHCRAQFFGLAARVMRNVLIDHIRRQQSDKRGGSARRLSLSHVDQLGATPGVDLLALDEALTRLAAIEPQHERIVELRFFGGLTIPETAEALGVSHATVERGWSLARAWLYCELQSQSTGSDRT